jgi:hypothetical protein
VRERPQVPTLPAQRQLPMSTPTGGYARSSNVEQPKARPRKKGTGRNGNVTSLWLCPKCGMRFDKVQDREDHVFWLHGEPTVTLTEPPPGHPDWMSPDEMDDWLRDNGFSDPDYPF